MTGREYLLDNAAPDTGDRFAALSALFDAVTGRHVEATGVGTGCRCWEVGAGGPSVPRMLAERVAPDGQVLATDLDVSWIADGAPEGVAVRRHDVAAEPPPEDGFDLVHARLVLSHVPGRDQALRSMASALRPGGWLLVEDFDVQLQPLACPTASSAAEHRANRIRAAFTALLAERQVDLTYGRTLPGRLREVGLESVTADAYAPIALPAVAGLERANTAQIRAGLVAGGHADDAEIDAHLAEVAAGRLDLTLPPLISALGRRPGIT